MARQRDTINERYVPLLTGVESASYACHATTASFAMTGNVGSDSASYAVTAAYVAGTVLSASHALEADFAVVADGTVSASYAISASWAPAATPVSVSHADNADQAVAALTATSASYASKAAQLTFTPTASSADTATSASYALTASYATVAQTLLGGIATADSASAGNPNLFANNITASVGFKGDGSKITGVVSVSYAGNTAAANTATSASYATKATSADSASAGNPTFYATQVTASSMLQTGFIEGLEQAAAPDTPDTSHGRLYAADFHGFTLWTTIDNTGETIQLARDGVIVGKNLTGATLSKGMAVYLSGSSGNVSTFGLAIASSSVTMPSVGLVLADISNNAFGRVLTVGLLESVDTTGFTAGDILYVSPTTAGVLTNVQPLAPNFSQIVGQVVTVGAQGRIQVFHAGVVPTTITGSFSGTFKGDGAAVINVVSASYGTNAAAANTATSASWADVAGQLDFTPTASSALTATSASYATKATSADSASAGNATFYATSITASTGFAGDGAKVTGVVSVSYASNAGNANTATTASGVTSGAIVYALSASYAISASGIQSGAVVYALSASYAVSASGIMSGAVVYALSASYAATALSASFASTTPPVVSASYATNAGNSNTATTASGVTSGAVVYALSASYAISASGIQSGAVVYALSASYAVSASGIASGAVVYALSASYAATALSASGIASGAVGYVNSASYAVSASGIMSGAIGYVNSASYAVSASGLMSGAIGYVNSASYAISASGIMSGAVGYVNSASYAISASGILSGAVGTVAVANSASAGNPNFFVQNLTCSVAAVFVPVADPPTPTGSIQLYATSVAGRNIIKHGGQRDTINHPRQQALYSNNFIVIKPSIGTALTTLGCLAGTSGTVSHPAVNAEQQGFMVNLTTGAVSGNVAAVQSLTAPFTIGAKNFAANGFFYSTRVSFNSISSSWTTAKMFAGMHTVGALSPLSSGTVAQGSAFGFYYSGEIPFAFPQKFVFMVSTGASASFQDTSMIFSSGTIYDMRCYCSPSASNTGSIGWQIDAYHPLSTSVVSQAGGHPLVPNSTGTFFPGFAIRTDAAAAVSASFQHIYCESDR